jgi:hypothetical protein
VEHTPAGSIWWDDLPTAKIITTVQKRGQQSRSQHSSGCHHCSVSWARTNRAAVRKHDPPCSARYGRRPEQHAPDSSLTRGTTQQNDNLVCEEKLCSATLMASSVHAACRASDSCFGKCTLRTRKPCYDHPWMAHSPDVTSFALSSACFAVDPHTHSHAPRAHACRAPARQHARQHVQCEKRSGYDTGLSSRPCWAQ